MVLAGAGGESTSSLTGSAVRILAERPELQAELRTDPALIEAFVEETVRLESSFRGHYRFVKRDSELGGVRLPRGSRRTAGPSLRTWLLYEGRRRRVVHRLDGPTHGEVSPGPNDLPGSWHPRACHLAPMPFQVQGELAAQLARRPDLLLSLDPYELVYEEALPAWHDLLAGCDLLFLSEDEMELPGGLAQPEPALRCLAGAPGRLRQVLYKMGARGGLAFDPRADRFQPWQPLPTEISEPTGAGDAFAGGLVAGLLLGDAPPLAIKRGLVSASFALGGDGPEALLDAGPAAATERLTALPPRA